MRRARLAVVAGVVVAGVVVAGGAGCGILNGLWWPAEVTDSEICTAVTALDDKQRECRGVASASCDGCNGGACDSLCEVEESSSTCPDCGGGGNDDGCDASCFRDHRDRCATEWEALLTCLLDDNHQCTELGSSDEPFCASESRSFAGCAGINADDPCGGGDNGSSCGTCNGGTCNGNCESGESSLCADCQQGGCNHDGQCNNSETQATCSDCGPCVNNGSCDPNESRTECPDCTGGGPCVVDGQCLGEETQANCSSDCGPCNPDSFCDPHESHVDCGDCNGSNPCAVDGQCLGQETQANCPADCHACEPNGLCDSFESHVDCADCTGPSCTPDGQCKPGEDASNCAADCAPLCSVDGDCGGDAVCDKLQRQLCTSLDPNCTSARDECRATCTSTADCAPDNVCVENPANGGQRTCEPAACVSGSQCDAARICAKPVEMNVDDGFCLPRCDPLACSGGGGNCSCNGALFNRCATVRDAGAVVEFACTTFGPVGPGQACAFEGDCNGNSTCEGGVCRTFCFNPGGTCGAGGTCNELRPGVGFCTN